MEITVEVTREDIKMGRRRSYYRCPIAISVKRSQGITEYTGVVVSSDTIKVWESDDAIRLTYYKIPFRATFFMFRFDHRLPWRKPFKFTATQK